jgi:hypothetical protein
MEIVCWDWKRPLYLPFLRGELRDFRQPSTVRLGCLRGLICCRPPKTTPPAYSYPTESQFPEPVDLLMKRATSKFLRWRVRLNLTFNDGCTTTSFVQCHPLSPFARGVPLVQPRPPKPDVVRSTAHDGSVNRLMSPAAATRPAHPRPLSRKGERGEAALSKNRLAVYRIRRRRVSFSIRPTRID